MFTDDMAILAKFPEELQAQLDTVFTYYEKWSIKVNVDKTKINVLRKRGGLLPVEKCSYAETILKLSITKINICYYFY